MDAVKVKNNLFPEKRTLADLERKSLAILSIISRTARENGVFAELLEINDGSSTNPSNGLYFIVTPDWQIIDSLKRNMSQFDSLLASEKRRSPHMMNCYYNIISLNDLSESNVFLKHQAMYKAVQDMAIVANAFFEYGYPLPKQVHEQTIENFYDYNARRNDISLPQRLRDSYDKIMEKAVTDAYLFYSKQEALSSLPTRIKDNNRISADYLVNNKYLTNENNINLVYR